MRNKCHICKKEKQETMRVLGVGNLLICDKCFQEAKEKPVVEFPLINPYGLDG